MPPLQPYRDFLKCLMYGLKRSNDATTVRTSLKKWIRFLSVYIAIIPAHLHCQMQPNPPGVEFLGTISKYSKRKFRRCLFTSSVKREIRHFHVVVEQKRAEKCTKKHGARAKFCLLIKPIVFLTFSLPSASLMSLMTLLSTTTVLFRTTFTRTIKLNPLLKLFLGSNLSHTKFRLILSLFR